MSLSLRSPGQAQTLLACRKKDNRISLKAV
jgi:hypothetical protein